MTIASADVLSGHLKSLCHRDNHVMKYESGGTCSWECLATRTPSTSLA